MVGLTWIRTRAQSPHAFEFTTWRVGYAPGKLRESIKPYKHVCPVQEKNPSGPDGSAWAKSFCLLQRTCHALRVQEVSCVFTRSQATRQQNVDQA